jgi:hypothetical protein
MSGLETNLAAPTFLSSAAAPTFHSPESAANSSAAGRPTPAHTVSDPNPIAAVTNVAITSVENAAASHTVAEEDSLLFTPTESIVDGVTATETYSVTGSDALGLAEDSTLTDIPILEEEDDFITEQYGNETDNDINTSRHLVIANVSTTEGTSEGGRAESTEQSTQVSDGSERRADVETVAADNPGDFSSNASPGEFSSGANAGDFLSGTNVGEFSSGTSAEDTSSGTSGDSAMEALLPGTGKIVFICRIVSYSNLFARLNTRITYPHTDHPFILIRKKCTTTI